MTVTSAGWERVNLYALPLLGVVALAVAWLAVMNRRPRAA
jgi:hypothetical protein